MVSLIMWALFHAPQRWCKKQALASRWSLSEHFSLLRVGQGNTHCSNPGCKGTPGCGWSGNPAICIYSFLQTLHHFQCNLNCPFYVRKGRPRSWSSPLRTVTNRAVLPGQLQPNNSSQRARFNEGREWQHPAKGKEFSPRPDWKSKHEYGGAERLALPRRTEDTQKWHFLFFPPALNSLVLSVSEMGDCTAKKSACEGCKCSAYHVALRESNRGLEQRCGGLHSPRGGYLHLGKVCGCNSSWACLNTNTK